MTPTTPRETHLFAAFSQLPLQIGDYTLRPMSPGSYTLLLQTENPLLSGTTAETAGIMHAVAEYIWIHAAPLTEVLAVTTRATLPQENIRAIAFALTMTQIMDFLDDFKNIANRMAAAMAEPAQEETTPGKQPATQATSPTSSPPSSSPSAQQETPPANTTSPGTPPSSEPSSISMQPTSKPEPPAAGPSTNQETPEPLPTFTPPSQPSAPAT